MEEKTISKNEFDSSIIALENILTQKVENIELTNVIPCLDDVTDSNRVFKGKLSILFVDIRKSTELTDELKSKKMVKVYRAFIRMVVQAVRYSGGFVRSFAGDGLMGVFQDDIDGDITILSSQKAVEAARYILTLIDFCLNPSLKKHMGNVAIGCGVGICTGEILIAKVGMRGKEADLQSESETDLVWIGSTTNYANRLCGLAASREIFIDENTYQEASLKDVWIKSSRATNDKLFSGYIAHEYYLDLPNDIAQEAVISEENKEYQSTFIQEIFENLQEKAVSLVDNISRKSSELAIALENIKIREEQVKRQEDKIAKEEMRLQQWQNRLNNQTLEVDNKDVQNKLNEYNLYKKLFESVHCKKEFAIGMGEEFWDYNLSKLIECGKKINKDQKDVRSEICYALVDLYENLGLYDEAYHALCIQAETHSWISVYTVSNILSKTYLHSQLKEIIEHRLQTAIMPALRKDLEECLTKFKQ